VVVATTAVLAAVVAVVARNIRFYEGFLEPVERA